MLDVVLDQMIIKAAVGGAVMRSLGASWFVWLLLWWAWCGLQVLLHKPDVRPGAGVALEWALLLTTMPVLTGALPFVLHSRLPAWL